MSRGDLVFTVLLVVGLTIAVVAALGLAASIIEGLRGIFDVRD